MSIFVNHIPSRILSSKGDKYGRWTRTQISLKQKTLVVYNTYRTHKKSLSTVGMETPWMHQWQSLRKDTGKDLDPRRQHVDDLLDNVIEDSSKGNLSLIFGDLNEDLLDQETTGIKKFEESGFLINAYKAIHGEIPSSRGNARQVFHLYTSPQLLPFISKISTLAPTEGFSDSDHVPFFVDLDSNLFAKKLNTAVPLDQRVLKMYDTINVTKYVKAVEKQLEAHNILNRLQHLETYVIENEFDKYVVEHLEKIDSHVTSIRLTCEKNLVPSPTRYKSTEIAKLQVQKLRLLEKLKKTHEADLPCDIIIKKLNTLELEYEINPDNLEAVLTEERQLLKQIQSDIEVHRDEHLLKLHKKLSEELNKDLATVIKEMRHREKQKRAWQKISFVTKAKSRGTISRLGIPKGMENRSTADMWKFLQNAQNTTEWTYIHDTKEIEARLLEWQLHHYNQASSTPFATSEWYNKLNPNILNEEDVYDILRDGLPEDDRLMESSRKLFEEISSNLIPEMPAATVQFTREKFQTFYKKTKEKTSSSPSGLHMGHWKAAALSTTISEVLSIIMRIAINNSYSLNRWKKVTGILLEKKSGHPTINKLRTIHIIESDLNYAMRMIWGREMMKWAEKHHAIHENQYGGRKGVQAQSASLNKTLTMDIIRYYGEPAMLVDNDAQACYDRIVPSILTYALLRLGLPLHMVKFQLKWLEQANYHLKLQKGLSASYSTTPTTYLFGTGQGTGWSPPCWGALSDLISRTMEKHRLIVKLPASFILALY